jgi:hypothetical protein
MISELRHRDPLLFWTGAAMMLAFIVVALVSIGDTRTVLGLNPWIKPMKFLTSVTIFMWTIAWFMPEARASGGSGNPRFDKRKVVSWTIALMMTGEIVLILLQSARGTTSHFNIRTGFDAAIFSAMGVMIILNTVATALFLWILRRDTPPQRAGYIWGIRLGLIVFLLASAEGGLIVSNNAHTVGAPDGGAGLPFVNWSTTHGDLRIAHFVGMHALQGLPLLGFFLDRRRVPARNLLFAVSILWIAVTAGLVLMALRGRPLLSL